LQEEIQKKLTNTKKELEAKLAQLKDERERLNGEKEVLSGIRATVSKEQDGLNNQCTVLQSSLEAEQETIGDLAGEHQTLLHERKALITQLEESDQEIATIQKEIEEIKQEKERQERERQAKEQQEHEQKAKHQSLQVEHKANDSVPSASASPSNNANAGTSLINPTEPTDQGKCQCCLIL